MLGIAKKVTIRWEQISTAVSGRCAKWMNNWLTKTDWLSAESRLLYWERNKNLLAVEWSERRLVGRDQLELTPLKLHSSTVLTILHDFQIMLTNSALFPVWPKKDQEKFFVLKGTGLLFNDFLIP
jgi:hypothetical protein